MAPHCVHAYEHSQRMIACDSPAGRQPKAARLLLSCCTLGAAPTEVMPVTAHGPLHARSPRRTPARTAHFAPPSQSCQCRHWLTH
eukprot:366346-Chlamydomonas_euryale.AAC.1